MSKTCKRCKSVKSIAEFGVLLRNEDGRNDICKSCVNLANRRRAAEKKLKERVEEIYPTTKEIIVDPPAVPVSAKEIEFLQNVPSRVLIGALRERGYRGELEKHTIEKVVI